MRKMKRIRRKIFCAAAVLALIFSVMPVMEVRADDITPGNYTVTVVPTYQNPDTGAIDDSGQNPGIGQMMVEAQMQTVGYVEIYDDGTIYLNVRLNLADPNIYCTFQTSSDYSSTWTERDFTVTNQSDVGDYEFMNQTFTATVTDFRFQIGTLNDTIRCTNYVEAMGREVVWFCYITNLTEGVGSDWTTIQAPNMADYTNEITGGSTDSTAESTYTDDNTDSTQTDAGESTGGSSAGGVTVNGVSGGSTGTTGGSTGTTGGSTGTTGGSSAGQVSVSGGSSSGSGSGTSSGSTSSKSTSSTTTVAGIKDRTVADAKVTSNADDAEIVTGKGLDDSTGIVGLDDDGTDSTDSTAEEAEESSSGEKGKLTAMQGVLLFIAGFGVGVLVTFLVFFAVSKTPRRKKGDFPDLDELEAMDAGQNTPAGEMNEHEEN